MDDRETILKVASELRQRIGCVHGLCCCASVVLAAMLRKKKLKPKILKGTFQTDLPTEGDYSGEHENGGKSLHYWVQVSGFLVDITADQFNAELEGDDQPEIVVFPPKRSVLALFKRQSCQASPLAPQCHAKDYRASDSEGRPSTAPNARHQGSRLCRCH